MTEMGTLLDFWLAKVGEAGWYVAAPEVDAEITRRFQPLWQRAWEGGLADWPVTAEGALAFLILTDQFPRNMFRGDPRAFATDAISRTAARSAIARNLDLTVPEPQRVFFYMPFEHSEDLADQDWSVALMEVRLPETGADFAHHARLHHEVIRRYGRFPYRNDALGRASTPAEQAFLAAGGYGAIVREFAG
ncbi:MAG: DUF924 domain-containing protein [Rhodobacteraceae bacterium]|nr:DUF924 domain-containing protein [Paracoccaceae bacterium]